MNYLKQNTKLKEALEDKEIGKYLKYIYYDYLDESHLNENIGCWSEYALDGLNWLKERVDANDVKQYFLNKDKKDVSFLHITHHNHNKVMIMVSGGGLNSVCHSHEGLPMSKYFYKQGFDIILLTYSINKDAYWDSTNIDLASCVKFIFDHKDELNIDPDDYVILGGSAGGFIAAEFGTDNFGYKKHHLPKPLCLCLLYPVISYKYHQGNTTQIILGNNITKENISLFSVDEHVDQDYPQTFLVHSAYDKDVSVMNSRKLKSALEKANVPCYYMEMPYPDHGFSVAYKRGQEGWMDCFMTFYRHCLEKIDYNH